MSVNCPLRVKATWAFKLFGKIEWVSLHVYILFYKYLFNNFNAVDFNDDNQITREDLCCIIDSLTLEPYLQDDEKYHICEIVSINIITFFS